MSKKLLINAKIYSEHSIVEQGYLLIEGTVIRDFGDMDSCPFGIKNVEIIDIKGKSVLPGFIDLQVNGAGGFLATENGGKNVPYIQKALARFGTTSFLVATSPCSDKEHLELLEYISKIKSTHNNGANLLGVHMEGPFLNPLKSGANDASMVCSPDIAKFMSFANTGALKMMTISPEIGDFTELIKAAKLYNITLSIGHTLATYEQALEAYAQGVCGVTHIFNTMNGITARDPGIVGATINSTKYATVVCDGCHVHPVNLKLLFDEVGADRLIIITDSAPTAGTEQAEWDFNGVKILVKNYTCFSEDGHIMGSSLTMNKGASIARKNLNCSVCDIIKMCSTNPAKYINIFDHKGSITKGKDADLIVLEDELSFDINKVYILGREFNRR